MPKTYVEALVGELTTMSCSLKSFLRCDRSPCSDVPLENMVMIRPPMMAGISSVPLLTNHISVRNESGARMVFSSTTG